MDKQERCNGGEIQLMSLSLLENNWNQIKTRVVDKLWLYRFKGMYESCKLDKDDFDSLAHIVLTKAFKEDYNKESSNVFTYATNVLNRKAKTELTYYHRKKRVGDIEAESISKFTDEETQTTLEDLLLDKEQGFEDAENSQIYKEVFRYLKNSKEKEIISLSIQGYDDENIAQKIGVTTERIRSLRKRLADTPTMRRALRKLGYSLGGIEL